jgi:hypothetical protein
VSQPNVVTQEVYDRLVQAFRATPGMYDKAAHVVGVSNKTAQRAWERGYEDRGMRPIKDVIAEIQAAALAKTQQEEASKQRAALDALAELHKQEGEVIRLDYKVLQAATGNVARLYALSQQVSEHVSKQVVASVAAGTLTWKDGLSILRQASALFAELAQATDRIITAARKHFGEPNEIVKMQLDPEIVQLLKYAEQMTPEELDQAVQTGRIPDRLTPDVN